MITKRIKRTKIAAELEPMPAQLPPNPTPMFAHSLRVIFHYGIKYVCYPVIDWTNEPNLVLDYPALVKEFGWSLLMGEVSYV